jgi:hypothetical protein
LGTFARFATTRKTLFFIAKVEHKPYVSRGFVPTFAKKTLPAVAKVKAPSQKSKRRRKSQNADAKAKLRTAAADRRHCEWHRFHQVVNERKPPLILQDVGCSIHVNSWLSPMVF